MDSEGACAYLIGCDVFKKYLLEVKKHNPYDSLVLCDIRYLPFKFGIINHIIALEVIEHLDKGDAKCVLKTLKELCSGNVVLTTPYFQYIQGEIRGNPHERHVSFWSENEFKVAGFETNVRGYEGILGEAVKNLRLTRFLVRVERILFRQLVFHLIIFRQEATGKHIRKR